ncbi:MAG: threo-3-hydroxy-L-aspartate ammonia-lyase [Spirochaetes bacterium]|nr:threo-3-hydroxy-L-aspartate ammonia-lyase [Spirochaetota bacterium]
MYEKITEAAARLKGVAHITPVIKSATLDEKTGNKMFLKCENFQRMGAFKFRGAYNALCALKEGGELEGRPGVISYSSGNHAQAVALAGRLLGITVKVVMPEDAPAIKLQATRGYGAQVILYDRHKASREEIAGGFAKEGWVLVPPFDSELILAGQGTAVKELIEETGALDYVLTPCGGGGLLSGSAISAKTLSPGCRVLGVEPELADDARRSLQTGSIQTIASPDTIADGLRTTSLGGITFPLIQKYADDIITVTEEEIVSTMYFLWMRLKIVVEPSGAVGLAPFFHRKLPVQGKRVGVVLSGGNADIQAAAALFATTNA